MQPNIFIGNFAIPSWYAMLVMGAVVATGLGVFCAPKNFALKRWELAVLAVLLIAAGLLGGRALFLILHGGKGGGFAYFGALILSIVTLFCYSVLRRVSFLAIADYSMPFLILSQVFVRIGCLMAGCCYGKPTDAIYGVIFKSVDKFARHPTQAYEALLLLAIYTATRIIYSRKEGIKGYTLFMTLLFYGIGRFFIEFLRTDSPVVFLNITLAQITCIALALCALILILTSQRGSCPAG